MVPPDPIPNSEVKRRCADGSVGLPHVRVGHRQVLNVNPELKSLGFLFMDFIVKEKSRVVIIMMIFSIPLQKFTVSV